MASLSRKKLLGAILCLASLGLLGGGWVLVPGARAPSTDNAYGRGEITSLAPKVAGYVVSGEAARARQSGADG